MEHGLKEGIRTAIIGCGRMGRERAAACRHLGAHLVLAYDNDPEQARRFAGEFSCDVLRDLQYLDWTSIDAIFVCIPPSSRGPVERAAIEHGIPVFMEKPVGLSVDQCMPTLNALKSKRVITAVGYMNRYRDSIQQVRNVLRGKSVLGASCFWLGSPYKVSWWASQELSGGAVNEQTTHLVDLARYLLGEVTDVHAMFNPDSMKNQSTGSVSIGLRIETGILCSILYSCLAETKMISFRIFTPEACIHLDGWDFRIAGNPFGLFPTPPEVDKSAVFREEVAAFLDAIRSGSEERILCNLEDALKTQLVVDAIQKSIRSGRTEKV